MISANRFWPVLPSAMQKDYDDPRMRNFLESANIRLLDDETVLIDKRFSLTGRKDPSRCRKMSDTRKDPDQLTACLDKTLPIIFMDHQPGQLDEVAAAGADLDLCGHTHDGQLFPLNIITGLIWENSCGYLKKGLCTTSLLPAPAYGARICVLPQTVRSARSQYIFILPDLIPLIPHKYLPPAVSPYSHYPLLLFLFRHFLLPFQSPIKILLERQTLISRDNMH